MIPKNIIEKAIAGGWTILKNAEHQNDVACDEAFALDPDFWTALGKEMGWEMPKDEFDSELPWHHVRLVAGYGQGWRRQALTFYDLILRKASQEEIDNFWKAL